MNPARGIALKLISVVVFMAMTSLIKATANDVPPGEAIFFRSLFALPIVIVMLAWTGHLNDGLTIVNRSGHLIRGVVGATAMALVFFALRHIPLPEVVAIFFATPIFVTLLAAVLLGERLRIYRIGAIILGLAGVLIIMSPRILAAEQSTSDLKTIAALAVFAGAFFAALAHVYVRKLMATDSAASVSFLVCPFHNVPVPPQRPVRLGRPVMGNGRPAGSGRPSRRDRADIHDHCIQICRGCSCRAV